jgi:hypothetical protein
MDVIHVLSAGTSSQGQTAMLQQRGIAVFPEPALDVRSVD